MGARTLFEVLTSRLLLLRGLLNGAPTNFLAFPSLSWVCAGCPIVSGLPVAVNLVLDRRSVKIDELTGFHKLKGCDREPRSGFPDALQEGSDLLFPGALRGYV